MSPFLAMPEERQTPKNSSRMVLTVILLAIIGYTSYRIWPPLLDIWQRMHEPAETTVPAVKAPSVTPAVNSAAPGTKSDDAVRSAEPDQKSAPPAAEENPSPVISSSPVAPAKLPESMPPPAAAETPALQRNPAGRFATPAASSLKLTLGSQLADTSLASKVKLHVTGNTLTLTGRLSPQEHSKVLTLLHNVPGGVRVIDDIGFADDQSEVERPAQFGWMWIRSMPAGAEIFVDGNDRGLQTPSRVGMSQGEHDVVLALPGYAKSHRSVLIEAGRNMQISEQLGPL
jgi:PEGA domain/YscD/CdsD-like Bon-like domain 3